MSYLDLKRESHRTGRCGEGDNEGVALLYRYGEEHRNASFRELYTESQVHHISTAGCLTAGRSTLRAAQEHTFAKPRTQLRPQQRPALRTVWHS